MRTRVLVVEDSLTVRQYLCEVLSRDPDLELAGAAADGRQAIEMCSALRPDVMTMDMMLPVMSGMAATEYIMAYCPTPILVVSASLNRGELFRTYDALAAGAVDVLDKPLGTEADGEWERRFLAAVKLVSRIRVITHPRARLAATAPAVALPASPAAAPAARLRLLVLGASTGGPKALVTILQALPAPYPVPILIVLHIGGPFAAGFAEWLGAQTAHPVLLARDGEPLAQLAGRVVLPGPDRHLVVRGGRLRLTDGPERNGCRPSVDELFESVAAECGPGTVAGLLTGMGRDGAAGLLAIRRAGGLTLAQDEASCVVFGMPKEAVALGAAGAVLPLEEMAAELAALGRTTGAV